MRFFVALLLRMTTEKRVSGWRLVIGYQVLVPCPLKRLVYIPPELIELKIAVHVLPYVVVPYNI